MPSRAFQSYIICTTPRSGSTMLCGMLAATKMAGNPDSHFHLPSLDAWLKAFDLKETDFESRQDMLRAVIKAAQARGKGDTDVFGLRMQLGSFNFFLQQLELFSPGKVSDLVRIVEAFGPTLFVYLSRPDHLDQAISRVRAEQTGLWHRRSDGTELERRAPSQEARYNAKAIAHHMAELAAFDEAWERWFQQQRLEPIRISYDALANDPQRILAKLLRALDLDPSQALPVETPTAKLADAESRQWWERFKTER